MKTEKEISTEHTISNKSVRKTLIERGIRPERLSPDEDIKKTERRLKSNRKLELTSSLENKQLNGKVHD